MSLESREDLVVLETVDPLDLSDHLDSQDLLESLAERSENVSSTQNVKSCVSPWVHNPVHVPSSLVV